MKIIKIELPKEEIFTLDLPQNSRILKFGKRNNVPVLWVAANENPERHIRRFQFIGTGHHCRLTDNYIGTVESDGGEVVHLFERTEHGHDNHWCL